MAQKNKTTRPASREKVCLGTRNEHVKNVLTKIHQIFVDHSSNNNNKIQKQKHSHSSNQELRLHRTQDTNGSVTPQTPSPRDVDRAIAILKSDTFACIYNVNKNIRESSLMNNHSNNRFDFQHNGEVAVLDEPPMYQFLKRESLPPSPSPSLSHTTNLVETQISNRSSINSENNDSQTRFQVINCLIL